MSKFYGTRKECCTDNNIKPIDDPLWQCQTCKRVFYRKGKDPITNEDQLTKNLEELKSKLEKYNMIDKDNNTRPRINIMDIDDVAQQLDPDGSARKQLQWIAEQEAKRFNEASEKSRYAQRSTTHELPNEWQERATLPKGFDTRHRYQRTLPKGFGRSPRRKKLSTWQSIALKLRLATLKETNDETRK